MLMVIFGAGASFDSSPTYTVGMVPPGASSDDHHNAFNRPPLAKELFANRPLFIDSIDVFPQCKTIVSRLRAPAVISGERSIEALLQEIEEEAKTYRRGPQELAAVRCYLQHAISECQNNWQRVTRGITNYLTLLREIERTHKVAEPVCLVTFNYDTLLENALGELGYRIDRIEDYTERPVTFRLFKPHGSVNWGQMVNIKLPANVNTNNPNNARSVLHYLIEHPSELHISNTFVLCPPANMGLADGNPVFPAIAIPVEKKDLFACPQIQIDRLTQALPEVSKILVIGWRATEAHFLELLRRGLRSNVQVHIVAGPVAGENSPGEVTKVNICTALLNNRPQLPTIDPGGFTDFLDSGRARSFLE
jgi:hypothetical protein